MSPIRRRTLPILPLLALALIAAPDRASAQCSPAACAATHVYLTFEGLPPGTPVEGLGAVHPDLNITGVTWPFGPSCAPGSATAIEENDAAFSSYGTTIGPTSNGCLTGIRGFGDSNGCVLDYDFTFAPGVTVDCFSIRMLDYGDLYPFGVAGHQVTVTAYDAANAVVDQDLLSTFGATQALAGDACDAGPNDSGNYLFTVTGPGITKVTLRFDAAPDPNVGFDDISFCESSGATSAPRGTWGALKTLYR